MPDPRATTARSLRRTDTTVRVQQFLDEMLFSPLHWPWKTVRLERYSFEDFRQRPLSASISVAELYHENSKLFQQMLPEIAAMRVDAGLRREFVSRRAVTMAAEASEVPADPPIAEFLARVASRVELELFYAIELRVVVGHSLLIYEPSAGTLHLVKRLSVRDVEALRQAVRLLAPPWLPPHEGRLLFIVGFFGRDETLLGPRGYRRTILDAGRIAQVVLEESRIRGQPLHPVYEFADRDVEDAIELDGTEVGPWSGLKWRRRVMVAKERLRDMVDLMSEYECQHLLRMVDPVVAGERFWEGDVAIFYNEYVKMRSFNVSRNPASFVSTAPAKQKGIFAPIPLVKSYPTADRIRLPPPKHIRESLSDVIVRRRSRRIYQDRPISLEQLATLLQHAAGITASVAAYDFNRLPLRTFPSAGGLQAPECYCFVRTVEGVRWTPPMGPIWPAA
jgi:hypothetical protein